MAFQKGVSGNAAGRPKVKTTEKLTNRILRERSFLEMVRKFRPLQAKALAAAVSIIDNKEAQDANKLKAAALLIGTYKDLIKETYDYKYDESENEEMQKAEAMPKFSLHVLTKEESSDIKDKD
jgi:hypothetical protein